MYYKLKLIKYRAIPTDPYCPLQHIVVKDTDITKPKPDKFGHLTINPTGNCQFTVLSYTNQWLLYSDKESFRELLKDAYLHSLKPLMMIDIKQTLVVTLKEYLRKPSEDIYQQFPYLSTNGSEMVLMFIRVANYKPDAIIP